MDLGYDEVVIRQNGLSIIIPTYNEVGNIRPMVERLGEVMQDHRWEAIFVDDDSPDGTASAVTALTREGWPVRCLRRIGRRGLSSAVVEGALAASFDILAVMDADFQHDESLLEKMLAQFHSPTCDLVVGSRYLDGGGVGDWSANRIRMSDLATRLSKILIGNQVTDPMSGFFMVRRSVFEACVYNLSQQGYKILLDIIASSPGKLNIVELPYVFRSRREGQSKLNVLIFAEYGFLLIEKLSGGLIPPRFVFFAIVGGLGLLVNIFALAAFQAAGLHFFRAEIAAIFISMVFNYVLNNQITYRDRRLKGFGFLIGLVIFCAICSVGALANVGVAALAIHSTGNWQLSGIAGALMGVVFNFGVAANFVWNGNRRGRVG